MTQDELKSIVATELKKRTSLSDIQKLLAEDHNYKMTFLDLRILASELEEVIESIASEDSAAEAIAKEEQKKEKPEEKTIAGTTTVEVSKLARPGSIANGTVKFASGASAEWVLDHYGRLGLDKAQGKPTEDDLKEFQAELQKMLSRGM